MPRHKGSAKTGGRQKGSPNRLTRAVREFLTDLVDDAEIQQAVRDRVLAGDTAGFFKALEMVHGKPRQSVQVNEAKEWIVLPAGDDVAVD
jgi:hypothetical protein